MQSLRIIFSFVLVNTSDLCAIVLKGNAPISFILFC